MADTWYSQTAEKVLVDVKSGEHGLSMQEAARRLSEYGPNALPEVKVDGLPVIFLRQFQSPLIYVLILAALAVVATGDAADAIVIVFVLIFNAIMGTIQEGRAQNTLLALKKFTQTEATVVRDVSSQVGGKELIIPDHEVVIGDVIVLQEGQKVPADARVIMAHNLKIDEASLTGESVPVMKTVEVIHGGGKAPSEQKNMVFKGTYVVTGIGRAVVTATGLSTSIGQVAKEISMIDTEIPLKANIRHLAHMIIAAVAVMSVTLFVMGISLGQSPLSMFSVVASLAVSVIPEGLPIALTIVLATGVWRMSKRSVLVKKLQAIEALGQAQIIAVDKTGTLTKNEQVIQEVWTAGKLFEIGGVGYDPSGEVHFSGEVVDAANHPELLFAGKIASLCASAQVMYSEEDKLWRVSGDPTEAAMAVLGEKIGFDKADLERESPMISEVPFDYKLKYHATIHKIDGKNFLTVVGAPEAVLALSTRVRHQDGSASSLTDEMHVEIESMLKSMSSRGLRILAFSTTDAAPEAVVPEDISELTFGGFFGMKDGLRAEVEDAMSRAKAAGIRVVMITGDHVLTARAIATEAGIFHEGDEVCTGEQIDTFSDAQLAAHLARVSVFARVTPEHKLRIVQAYEARGEIIAMTGDGVNDAPSLVAANLGVAMGKIGTEVAKEASDIVLLDDNFGSIISAVEEGRSIYRTIKKVILYLFSTSMGEVLLIFTALLAGLPLPLLAAQIIWLNFVTDGFLVLSLAMEPKEKNLLSPTYTHPKGHLLDSLVVWRIVTMAIPMMVGTLTLFSFYVADDMTKAWTISLTTLAVFQWFNAWNCRSETESIFRMNPFSNKFLISATGIVIVLQVFALHNPLLQKLLHMTPLALSEWFMIIPVAASVVVVEEIRKFIHRSYIVRGKKGIQESGIASVDSAAVQ
ncbi:HAD-IC family P-type ATPase [Candidatus Kaiserbacteria bacterium]|nr:HAD-IC family P-type ATPase [Candidatus Kaiserbacteria bacterium]